MRAALFGGRLFNWEEEVIVRFVTITAGAATPNFS